MIAKTKAHLITSNELYNDLLEKIISLECKPGELISENDLCDVYNTTRHTVRGALASLKELGFVEVYPQRGTFVSLINLDFIENILYIREAVAQETIHEIMKNGISTEHIDALHECLAKQKKIKNLKKDSDKFYELDDEFHSLLLKSVGREDVFSMLKDGHFHVRRWRNVEVETLDRIEELPKEHEQIIKAIEEHDESMARKLLNHHIDSVNQYSDAVRKKHPEYFSSK